MPAPVPTPSGVVRCHLIHTVGVDTTLGCHFDLSYTGGPPGTSDLETVGATVSTAYGAHLASLLSANSALESVEVVDLANPSTPPGIESGVVDGTRSGTQTPISVCMNLSFVPSRRYRGSKPKMFAPWGVEGDLGSIEEWGGTFITAVNNAWTAFINALTGVTAGGILLGVQVEVSYYQGKHANPNPNGRLASIPTPRTVPLVSIISSHSGKGPIGSQRRRVRAL